jgi:hypothetical protein
MRPGAKTARITDAGRGPGRPRIAEGVDSVVIQIRVAPEQRDKFHALGGAEWFRRMLNRAKVPTTTKEA